MSSFVHSLLLPEYQARISEDQLLFNFAPDDESARFYDSMFSQMGSNAPDKWEEAKLSIVTKQAGKPPKAVQEIVAIMEKHLDPDSVVMDIGGGFHQRRSGYLYEKYQNYIPLNLGFSNLQKYADAYQRPAIVADAKRLPFEDASIDCVFTHTFLEHPLEPEQVLLEIARVVKPGGLIIHCDAWFCRWWQRYGVVGLKSFWSMSLREKLIFIGAKITEFPLIRFTPIILRRWFKETFRPVKGPVKFSYGKLNPNYDLYLGCDEDAANSIDPLDVIRFYEGQGGTLFPSRSLKNRLLFRSPFVMIRR